VVVALAVTLTATGTPAPGPHGKGLGITIALAVFVLAMLVDAGGHDRRWTTPAQVAVLLCGGGAAVALAALQPSGVSELPASAVVFVAAMRLGPLPAALVAGPTVVGLGIAVGLHSAGNAAASILLCVVLGIVGAMVRQAQHNQDRTELLLAELEDARDDQARAAAADERARIARDLHDVLAHSLSGLSIQLEGAKRLARAEGASQQLRDVIDRSSALSKQGLTEARAAVGALRDGDPHAVDHLPELIEQFRRDFGLPVDLVVEGTPRPVPAEVGLTLYRVAGEALTNVARHAPGAPTTVTVGWDPSEVRLRVDDQGGGTAPEPAGGGGGWGLTGIGERVARLGGRCAAGPLGAGWSVDIVVPA
jgi:signal transduction histidine kinase